MARERQAGHPHRGWKPLLHLDVVRGRWKVGGSFDWGPLIAVGLALVAAAPFLTRPGLPRQTDAELHVYRAAELGHILRAGAFYPRWAPDLYLGYGYPIFNYYAPLTYYLANFFDLLPGMDIVGGVKAVCVLGLVLASLGSYLLGRELFGPAAGTIAAASFTFAPYIVFIDPHARGALAEHFAWCLLPLTFYAFHRLMGGVGGRWALLGSVLVLAALVFSHNLAGLVAVGLLTAYWVWGGVLPSAVAGLRRLRPTHFSRANFRFFRASASPNIARPSRAGWGGLALVLALAIVAFFWLPVLLERGAVKLNVIGPGHFDFHEHFLLLGELLAPSRILDLGATAPRYRFNLGLGQWLLALPALVVLLRCRLGLATGPNGRERYYGRFSPLLYFALAGLGLIFLMLPASAVVWEAVPFLPYLQFPWRLLGPANLMLAVCAAASTGLLPVGRWRAPALAAMLGVILALALPVLYPPLWAPDFGGTAPQDIIFWELESGALGTTSTGDFVPKDAALVMMYPVGSLVESYSRSGPVDRVNRASLPEGARVEIVEQGALFDRFNVFMPERFILRLFIFYFPGWRAYVDGEEVEIEVAGPEGFITLWVPEGEHEVLVRFGDTPPRTAGWAISAAGLVALIVALFQFTALRFAACLTTNMALDRQLAVWLGGVLLLFVVLKSGVIDRHDNWLRYTSPPGQAWAAQHEQQADFCVDGVGQIELLGYDLPAPRVRSGGTFPVVLYWHAAAPVGVNYQSFVHLARPLHILWGQEDHLNPGGLPTTRWPLDKYVWDEYEIRVLPGTPPGEYALNVGLYSLAGGYRLHRCDADGRVTGDSVVISSIEVGPPRRQPRPEELGMTREVMKAFPEAGVTLLGYTQPYDRATLPGSWPLTFFWRADRDAPAARTRALVLLDGEGREIWRLSGEPVDGHYPFEMWQDGEIVRDPLLFAPPVRPVRLNTGVYRFGVAVDMDDSLGLEGEEEAGEAFVLLGSVEFTVEEEEGG